MVSCLRPRIPRTLAGQPDVRKSYAHSTLPLNSQELLLLQSLERKCIYTQVMWLTVSLADPEHCRF